MRRLRLPASLLEHPVAIRLSQYIESMGPTSVYLSTIVYHDHNGIRKFLTKDDDFPFVEFDWLMYCCMRSWAKTIVTSGATVRMEPLCYSDDRGSFGNS